ncbi:MAG: [acyl-carrier-protein] S-malonyltransferase [Nitrospirae bacterium]|nr:MAG: [acyl-carrier-protein] S-malonyltransferase [Nitrospirota bacterium]
MGKDLCDNFEEARTVYDEASAALGYDVSDLSFNGPKDELNKTFRTQPCLLTASIAAYKVLQAKGITPDVVAGHSLGEYSAIVAAGVLPFSDAAGLTEKRGTFMQEAVPEGKGLMAAIIGISRDVMDRICLSVRSGYVSPANYNCPGQIVIAGEKEAVEEAMALATEAGARKVVALAVSAPSHCTLMVGASKRLGELLESLRFATPAVPVVNNADAMFLTNGDRIKVSLIKQLNSPLLWEDSVRAMTESGIDTYVEVGPGRVLSGLVKRISSSVRIFNVEDSASLDKTIQGLTA